MMLTSGTINAHYWCSETSRGRPLLLLVVIGCLCIMVLATLSKPDGQTVYAYSVGLLYSWLKGQFTQIHKTFFFLFGWNDPLTVGLYASLSLVSYDALFPASHVYSFAPTRLHCVPVSVCMCFAYACLGDSRMSFSRVLCVRDNWSMYAFGRIAANSVFIFLNKLLPSPDALCFFPCCHWWVHCECGSVYAFSHTCFCNTKSQ